MVPYRLRRETRGDLAGRVPLKRLRRLRETAEVERAERGPQMVSERRLVVDDRALLPRSSGERHGLELVSEIIERAPGRFPHALVDVGETGPKGPLRLPLRPLRLAAERFHHLAALRVVELDPPRHAAGALVPDDPRRP